MKNHNRNRSAAALLTALAVCLSGCEKTASDQRPSLDEGISTEMPAADACEAWEKEGETGIRDRKIQGRIVLRCPEGWSAYENAYGCDRMFVSNFESIGDDFKENINLVTEDLSLAPMSIDSYLDQALSKLEETCEMYEFEDLRVVEKMQSALGKYEARRIIYTLTVCDGKEHHFKFLQDVTVVNDKGYVVTYGVEAGSFDAFLPLLDAVVDSFELR